MLALSEGLLGVNDCGCSCELFVAHGVVGAHVAYPQLAADSESTLSQKCMYHVD